jgi:hypothetical protein
VDGRHDPVHHPAVLRALAHRQDARVGRRHAVVDDDPALHVERGDLGEVDARPNADRHHDEVAFQLLAAGQTQPLHPAVADHRLGAPFEQHLDAEALHRGREQCGAAGVELALHQPVHQVDHGHRAAVGGEAVGRLQSEQAAADHRGAAGARGRGEDRGAVVGAAEGVHAGAVDAVERRHQGVRASGEHAAVEGQLPAVVERGDARVRVERDGAPAHVQRDVPVRVPLVRTELERIGIGARSEQRGEAHPVVGQAGLAAHEGQAHLGVPLAQRLADRLARDAATDHQHAAHRASS